MKLFKRKCEHNWCIDNMFVGLSEKTFSPTKNAQCHLFQSEDWIFFVPLAMCTCSIWHNVLSGICQSIRGPSNILSIRLLMLNCMFVCVCSRTVINTTSSTLSSTASSQDSLNRSQKKKGLKSSIRTLFSKKEKQKSKGSLSRDMQAGTLQFCY